MHVEVQEFCLSVKKRFPSWPHPSPFHQARVLDCGSLDINGNNRYLFTECEYTGIDIVNGSNVTDHYSIVGYHDNVFLRNREQFDTIISTEVLEHDADWKSSLKCMYAMLKPGGLLIITCATGDRPEHGTADRCPNDSPLTNDYYRNLDNTDLLEAFGAVVPYPDTHPHIYHMPPVIFSDFCIQVARDNRDLYFWGVKAG